jgi:hypothetical protein
MLIKYKNMEASGSARFGAIVSRFGKRICFVFGGFVGFGILN